MSTLHLQAIKVGLDAVLALGTPTLSFMALGYTPIATTDSYWSDVSASQAAGTTDVVLSGVTTTLDVANARVELDTADISESTITTTTDKYVLWVDTTVDSTSPILATMDIVEGTLSPTAGTLAITVNVEGHYALKAV